ncbi:ABC-three component system middle component 1 [Shewanella surugensis]|uniref:Uncharacterized protein n=1 Tax=Shewanella surugensis TaxID=212020 RepID=A0ABT0LEZ9_9GAMM|nr:ABC-three component system middle component 1 [Shewanella surugensis]MCL1126274.1 hypothetical protein [Shewanella surugensis]
MINQIITDLSRKSPCQFELVVQAAEQFSFYRAASINYQRFLVVVRVSKLMKPSELNQWVSVSTPNELREEPAFAKNTDVVVLFELDCLAEIVNYENEVFALEEDSYSFKKHVLYFSQAEVALLADMDSNNIADLIKNKNKFEQYKESPLSESEYGLASRIFIKLPFLLVPVDESELDDPCGFADTYLESVNLLALNNEFESKVGNGDIDYDSLIKEYISGKMAN